MSKEKRNYILSIVCKILLILSCLEVFGVAYLEKIAEFFEKFGVTQEFFVCCYFGVAIVQITFVVFLIVKYDLKLDNPHTKKYPLNYNNFPNLNKYIKKELNDNDYKFIKSIQFLEELEIHIYLKKGRLLLIVESNEFSKKEFANIITQKFYKDNLKKLINVEANINELIIIYSLEKYNLDFEKNFINNVFIFDNYYYTVPVAYVYEKNMLYLPKVIDFQGTYKKMKMIKDITKIFDLKKQKK